MGCVYLTAARLAVWQSDVTLWAATAVESASKPRPWVNFGTALAADGQVERAMSAWFHAERLAEVAPVGERDLTVAIVQLNRALVAYATSDPDAARAEVRRLHRTYPNWKEGTEACRVVSCGA